MLNNPSQTENSITVSDLTDAFIRVLNKAAAVEKEPVDIGHGVLIYTSEVHLIEFIARYPEESISALATRIGVTKGAVSQTATKLEKKGYIKKYSRYGDKKTILLCLTERGKEALAWHRRYHEQMDHILASHLTALTGTDREHLLTLLSGLEEMFDACPKVREKMSSVLQNNPADP